MYYVECGELNQHPDQFGAFGRRSGNDGSQNTLNSFGDTFDTRIEHFWYLEWSNTREIDQTLQNCLRSEIRVRPDVEFDSRDRSNSLFPIDLMLIDAVSLRNYRIWTHSRQSITQNHTDTSLLSPIHCDQSVNLSRAELLLWGEPPKIDTQTRFEAMLIFWTAGNMLRKLRFQGF